MYEFVQLLLAMAGVDADELHPAGTAAWRALPNDDPAKLLSCLLDSPHHALRIEVAQAAMADASRAISSAVDWGAVSREFQQLNRFRAAHPWAKRVTS